MTLQSISSSFVASAAGGAPAGRGILQAQLTRYEVQLADWCSCPGGKTAEGKAKIADLQQKADTAKAQIKKIDDARAATATAASPVDVVATKSPDPRGTASGSRVDVYA